MQYPRHIDQWLARWEVSQPDDPAQRIWSVTYGLVATAKDVAPPPRYELWELLEQFRSVLKDASGFAFLHDLQGFGKAFERGLSALDGSVEPTFPDYVDFVCLDSYPAAAQRLFAAAYAAWVFGGMGSWNDLGFDKAEDNHRYEKISSTLYAVINAAIESAANSFQTP